MKQPLDHLRSRKKPVSRRLPIALDSEQAERAALARAHAVMKREQAEKRVAGKMQLLPDDQRLLREADEAEEEADRLAEGVLENSAWFVIRSLGPNRYEELQAQHPPTDKQRKEAREDGVLGNLGWNPDTFPIAIIAACCYAIDPETQDEEQLTEDYVKEMYEGDDWNLAECNALLEAALAVNQQRRVVDQGNGFGRTRRS